MRNRPAIVAAIAGLIVGASVTGGIASADAPPNACDSSYVAPMNSTAKLRAYIDCRDDRIEHKLDALAPSSVPTGTPSGTPTSSVTPTPTVTPTSATPGPTGTASPTAGVCQPGAEIVKFDGQGSRGLDAWGPAGYDASAELWGTSGYNYAQTMGVCSHDSWYVDVTTDNSKGDGAVKAYPSMRRIYHDWSKGADFSGDPLVASFPQLSVTFAATDPATCPGCIYDTAFDLWLNGIGNGTANEVMIWTRNVGQTPYGGKVASGISLAGHTWDLWSGNSNHVLSFVATDTADIAAGTFDMKDFLGYLMAQNRLDPASRLGQISYGVETVSTNAVSRHWDFTAFTVVDN